jgi:hypothetical protein
MIKARSTLLSLTQAKRRDGRRVHDRGNRQIVIALVVRDRGLGQRIEYPVYRTGVIPVLLQLCLNVCHDLVRVQTIKSINRAIVWIGSVARIVTPRRVPIA